MKTDQTSPCVFCGSNTVDEQVTRIGTVFIHPECFLDLEEILSIKEEELE